ncbi:DsbE family thiol:disulfide interchange protein [Pseudomonas sp. OIL-1]|uniref:DsbE family thiol:disulfide interchange protein n=1 Tax=Pseudomonas sp. OIL-1 TaxID=2706126 RepID=UPI0013A73FF1|nr:DsbE family thiol:disulfide interchange protein [Pseudomonas sp. OIL-1]QIB52667.1 DsbE family thiol:disulfide interchange protein [Pseudomonas sp. OIL-1]
MRRILLIIPLVLFFGLAGFFLKTLMDKQRENEELAASGLQPSTSLELPSALIGKPFPDFTLPSVEDPADTISTEDLIGRPALVNVWGTWCVACRVEHPVLNKLSAQGVVIHGINYKDDNASAQKWLKEFHDPYQLNISDAEGRLGLDLGVYGAPETFLIDADGVIRYKFIGVVDERVWERELQPRYQALVDGGQP